MSIPILLIYPKVMLWISMQLILLLTMVRLRYVRSDESNLLASGVNTLSAIVTDITARTSVDATANVLSLWI